MEIDLSLIENVTEYDVLSELGDNPKLSLNSVILNPNGCTIGDDAFNGCTDLSSVKNVYKVTSIGNRAFKNCSSFKLNNLPELTGKIGDEAFYGCSLITYIYFPNCTSIGSKSLGKTNIKSIDLPLCTNISSSAFEEMDELLTINIPKCDVSSRAFYGDSKLDSVILNPNGCTIGDDAFNGCTDLSSVKNVYKVTSIGNRAFKNCYEISIKTLSVCNTIGSEAFYGCSLMNSLYAPECSFVDLNAFAPSDMPLWNLDPS